MLSFKTSSIGQIRKVPVVAHNIPVYVTNLSSFSNTNALLVPGSCQVLTFSCLGAILPRVSKTHLTQFIINGVNYPKFGGNLEIVARYFWQCAC